MTSVIYRFDTFALDEEGFCLFNGEERVPLEPKSLRVLILLVQNAGKLVEKDKILDTVWKDTFVEETTLTRAIALLRKQLGDEPRRPRFIETVPTLGYRFIAKVELSTLEREMDGARCEPVLAPPAADEAAPAMSATQVPASQTLPAGPQVLLNRRKFLWAAGAAAVAGGGVWLARSSRRSPAPAVHVVIQLVDGSVAADDAHGLGAPVIAPDGSAIVVSLSTSAGPYLFHRLLNSDKMTRLDGTQGASGPFWSPDGQHVGFFANAQLKRMPVAGGSPIVLCPAPEQRGGSWGSQGTMVFGINLHALYKVSENGGAPMPVTSLDKAAGENSHRYPVFLPDGNRFLYFARTDDLDKRGIYLESLDHSQPRRRILVADGQFALGLAPDSGTSYLLTRQTGRIIAQSFDVNKGAATGVPHAVLDRAGQVSVSDTGVLVLRTDAEFHLKLLWFDRAGRQVGQVGGEDDFYQVSLSPDGRFVAAVLHDSLNGLHKAGLFTLPGGSVELFSDLTHIDSLSWSRDRTTLFYGDFRENKLYRRKIEPRGPEELLLQLETGDVLRDISPDGRFAVGEHALAGSPAELAWTPIDQRQWRPLAAAIPLGRLPAFSPDGRWVAFSSRHSGKDEIYVTDFPGGTVQKQISVNGGSYPRWRRDAKELFYIDSGQFMSSVDFAGGGEPHAGVPKQLFRVNLRAYTSNPLYDVSSDGQRFLVIDGGRDTHESTIEMVLNWPSLLPR